MSYAASVCCPSLPCGPWAAGLAEALLAIHDTGIVHRDLKPGNVLVAEDGPRVIDFGISSAVDATQLTRTGAVMGTPGFMAPEQIVSSREAGPAADVFSLGCVLVFAATGRGPFGAGGTAEILYRAVHQQPQLDGVPQGLGPLIGSCLDKDPARRPPAASVLAALGEPTLPRCSPRACGRTWRGGRRTPPFWWPHRPCP